MPETRDPNEPESPARPQGPARSAGRRHVIAVALGLAIALGAADVALRVTRAGTYDPRVAEYSLRKKASEEFWRMDPQNPPTHTWDRDPYGTLPPGAKMTYEVNSAGLRGPLPEPGVPTVLVMGDSFTFGEGVALEDTFTARLSRFHPSGPVFVNAGVPGYGTREEAARLPLEIERFKPVAVLLVFVPNDATPLYDAFEQEDFIVGKAKRDEQPAGLPGLLSRVLGRSAGDDAVIQWQLSYYTGARRGEWAASREALASMQRVTKARGIPFGVAHFPLLTHVADRPFQPIHDAVAGACKEFGIPFLDLTPAFERIDDWKLWVHPTDHHPNALAHARAAAALEPFVGTLLK